MDEPSSILGDDAKRDSSRRAARPQAGSGAGSKTRPAGLAGEVVALSGVGPRRAALLARLGVRTIGELLDLPPRRFVDLGAVEPLARVRPGATATCSVEVRAIRAGRRPGGGPLARAGLRDASGECEAIWFGQPFLARSLPPGSRILVHGRMAAGAFRGFVHPEWERLEDPAGVFAKAGLLAFYPLTEGLTQKSVRGWIGQALAFLPPEEAEAPILEALRRARGWPSRSEAFRELHRPESREQARRARQRLAFDELLAQQLHLRQERRRREGRGARPLLADPEATLARAARFPFPLTPAQREAAREILEDLRSARPMARLLHGEVGSGKTVVIALACAHAADSGAQACVLAPTEVLALQHAESFSRLLPDLADACGLLTASTPPGERRALLERLHDGRLRILIGTHAVLSEDVSFASLDLVVIDEQHRFGVIQRLRLLGKATAPHVLVVSATPIPRTLALAHFGDLEVTGLAGTPPGRTPARTRLVPRSRWEDLLRYVAGRLARGEQAYFVSPVLGAAGRSMLRDARKLHTMLTRHPATRGLRIELLHGNVEAKEARRVVDDLRAGRIDLLVATSVIEVGFDLPRATLMVVEHPERFGLAQLHQLRGRIGRAPGATPYCFLVLPEDLPASSLSRLRFLARESRGERIAEEDLRRRGPGDLGGLLQAGSPGWRIARLPRDRELLALAHSTALRVIDQDPELALPGLEGVRERVAARRAREGDGVPSPA